ncbi:glycosyltransferase [Pseudodesulfovibrio sp. F-1]|uniref:Glycosyltransferase n=1 Tax=Pseudodesulfovibrio alkaliphilus TaxID=2661613 RepID=A0A7K1KMW3_9BACT|nr:glycosyltransferase [Pseudodesulfovibrio alkaliphilus]MUM77367.1 glycosyltransferase [Pseudodesulfovibrio alkaliphilus]
MSKRTICFFNSNKVWGGGEKWHHDFALLMRDRGYPVHVVTNAQSELYERLQGEPGIRLFKTSIRNLTFLNPLALGRLVRHFRREKVDTVVMALPSDVKTGGIAARLAGVRHIVYRRGLAAPVRNTAMNRFLFGSVVTKLITNSQETLRMFLVNNPDIIDRSKAHLVHCGFDVEEFDAQDATPIHTKKADEIVIGNAGRLCRQKGQDILLDIARILKDRGRNFTVLIAGKGEEEDALKAKARALGVEDVVKFLGFVTNMKGFQASLDIFALTSLWEGFCYVQMEAMVLERPVVAFNISSIPEVLADGETGFLVPPPPTEAGEAADRDSDGVQAAGPVGAEAFADKLELLMDDPELRKRMGRAGRERVLENFTMLKTLNDFIKVVES